MNAGNSPIAVIIQARMGSTRRPGKMLADLAGRTLMEHILDRSLAIGITPVVLATTTDPADEELERIAAAMGVRTVRGSIDNVLERYLAAVDATAADYVVRVCGDAPLFDPGLVATAARELVQADADLVLWDSDSAGWAHQGIDLVSVRALRWSLAHGSGDRRATEHVTAFAKAHRDRLRSLVLKAPSGLHGHFKFSIDTPEDLEFIRAIYERLYRPSTPVALDDAVALVRDTPALAERNEALWQAAYGAAR